jgi:hypothetical protein
MATATQSTLIRQLTPTGEKSQLVRLMDVFVFGPLMISAAAGQKSRYFAAALLLVGLGTIVYNGANYLETRRKQQTDAQLAGLAQRAAPHPGRRYPPGHPWH